MKLLVKASNTVSPCSSSGCSQLVCVVQNGDCPKLSCGYNVG